MINDQKLKFEVDLRTSTLRCWDYRWFVSGKLSKPLSLRKPR